MPILPKITNLLFSWNILRKKCVMQFTFCMKAWKLASNWYYDFDGDSQVFPKFPNNKFAMSLQYLKREVRDEVDFLHADKVSYKLIATFQSFPQAWYYHYWWVWSNILKVLKVTSLQYLYNISKKKLGMEFIFCMQINIKTSTSWHYRFWWK